MKSEIQLNAEALKFRDKFGHSNKEPIDIFNLLLSDPDYTLIKTPLSDNISGMCIRDEESKFIALNSRMSLGRQRFAAAHELYHLEISPLTEGRICGISLYDTKNDIEKEADTFASFLLMPYDGLEWYIDTNRVTEWIAFEVMQLSLYFGISFLAAIHRLESEGRISKENALELKNYNIRKEAFKYGFDSRLYYPTDEEFLVMGNYQRKLETCKEKGIIKTGLYNQYIREAFLDKKYFPEEEKGAIMND